jgi:hypothetical protein
MTEDEALKMAAMLRHLYQSGYSPAHIALLTSLDLDAGDVMDTMRAPVPGQFLLQVRRDAGAGA